MEKRHNNIPLEKELADNLGKVAYSLDKAYMAQLCDDYHVIPFTNYIKAYELCVLNAGSMIGMN